MGAPIFSAVKVTFGVLMIVFAVFAISAASAGNPEGVGVVVKCAAFVSMLAGAHIAFGGRSG